MNIPIRHKHAAICFVGLTLFTLLCGLGFIVIYFQPFLFGVPIQSPIAWALFGFLFCFLSVLCAWSSWSLFKQKPKAGLIATITWLIVGILTLWFLFSVAEDGWHVSGIIVIAMLGILEFLIAIYLIKRRHEPPLEN